ncbi:cation-translocating P-type ATPase [Helicovermis profundi]|uniref:Permease n=1 Tax=Helicovermis profundi TaxID=3065157 RepID=A0AAU9ENE6_9FIRM|nr:hypothetical protein HLPR_03010 [Clostridia bacterium S502]
MDKKNEIKKENNMKLNKQMNSKKNMKNKKSSKIKWIMLSLVSILYITLFFFNKSKTIEAFNYSINLFLSIIPVLFIVLIIMFLFNLINEEKFKKMVENSSRHTQYIVMTILGTLSHGPIYAWYPLMKDLKNKGITDGSISSFLYSRGIKLTFLPALVIYFGLKYTIILTSYMFLFSYLLGVVIDFINPKKAVK